MIRAIIFDADGVIVSSKDLHYETLNRALNDYCPGSEISREEHLTIYDGLPTKKKLEMLVAKGQLPEHLPERVNMQKQRYTAKAIADFKFGVYHKALLDRLQREGFLLAICSNAIPETVHNILDNLGISDFFDAIFCNDCVSEAKPSPAIYLHAMNELRVHPHETIILEDSEYGLQAALASGAFVKKINVPEDLYNFNFSNK